MKEKDKIYKEQLKKYKSYSTIIFYTLLWSFFVFVLVSILKVLIDFTLDPNKDGSMALNLFRFLCFVVIIGTSFSFIVLLSRELIEKINLEKYLIIRNGIVTNVKKGIGKEHNYIIVIKFDKEFFSSTNISQEPIRIISFGCTKEQYEKFKIQERVKCVYSLMSGQLYNMEKIKEI